MIYKISSPVTIVIPRKTKKDKIISLNLNVYRNTHFQVLNQIKIRYKELILPQLNNLPVFKSIHTIQYVLYTKRNNRSDIANVCCIVDKFFCDALVESGHLPDDNYNYLTQVVYSFGSIDRTNPRTDIYIYGETLNENPNQPAGN